MGTENLDLAEETQNVVSQIVNFMAFSQRLKSELRHCWMPDGKQETVAAHCWQMALLAVLTTPYLEQRADILKALKMVVVHDIVEAEVGDIPYTHQFGSADIKAQKQAREEAAIEKIKAMLPEKLGIEIYDLWHEFEALKSPEAKLVKALDNLEAQIQHNFSDLSTWESIEYDFVYTKMDRHCQHDSFLSALCDKIKNDAEKKMLEGGINVTKIKERLAA